MIGRLVGVAIFIGVAWCSSAGTLQASTYFGYEDFGGRWYDAEKTAGNADDERMCWAATSANILAWSGWGGPFGKNTDDIFANYQDHWTDEGQHVKYALNWWFDGKNHGPKVDGYASIEKAGGGYFGGFSFSEYYKESWDRETSVDTVSSYLHAGYGVGITIYKDDGIKIIGHALTVWGYDCDDAGTLLGLHVTDSDNHQYLNYPPDTLNYYSITYQDNSYYLQGHFQDWYIHGVHGLQRSPWRQSEPVPEPATILLFGTGLLGLLRSRFKK